MVYFLWEDSRTSQTVLKKPESKADMRDKLREETERFIARGGNVDEIPQGVSGQDPKDSSIFLNRRLFVEPKATRTLVPEVVAAIEERRKSKYRRKSAIKGKTRGSRRKVIYDDFGEPLRRIWSDD
jgi:hypothetical protein